MNVDSSSQLLSLLEEWRRLTHLEGQAIRSENWATLAQQQEQKSQLRQTIDRALQQREDGSNAKSHALGGNKIQAVVAVLVALEEANLELLTAKREGKRAELNQAGETARALQGVRRAYGGNRSHHWQSYS